MDATAIYNLKGIFILAPQNDINETFPGISPGGLTSLTSPNARFERSIRSDKVSFVCNMQIKAESVIMDNSILSFVYISLRDITQ